jgi:septal ring factor EnvC (AmiA/AmiB activator)
MKALKQVVICLVATAVLFALTGCSTSNDESEKMVSQLNKTKAELEQANARIAELGEPSPRDTQVQNELAAAQQRAEMLDAKVKELTDENGRLGTVLEESNTKLAALEKKLQEFQGLAKDSKTDLLQKK